MLSHAHSLVNAVLGPLGLQLERKSARMPDAPELPPRLLSGCRVLASREQLFSLLPTQGTAAEVGS